MNATETTLAKYPKMNTQYFIDVDGKQTQVFKLNASTTAKSGATVYSILTSTGNIHKFAADVDMVDREAAREKQKQERELFNLYRRHEIGLEQYTKALAEIQ